MPDLIRTLRRLMRRIAGARDSADRDAPAVTAAVDGASAIALTEAAIAEAAGLAARGDSDVTAAFEGRLTEHRTNLLGGGVSGVDAGDARATIAAAVGLSLSGLRATAFAGAGDLTAARDQLAVAAGRHAPLVLHLGCRATGGPGLAVGSGHDAYHAVSDAGLVQLFASNVQEAVDLALIARRVAEEALVPVLVAADWDETIRSIQEVELPSAELIARYLGAPGDQVDAPTPAQAMLFGDRRRRLPRWFDLARPTLLGAVFGRESYGVAAAGARPFFADHVAPILDRAAADLAALTGRDCGALRAHRVDGASAILLAQGASVELAVALADQLRRNERREIGVIGVRALRPLAGRRLAELMGGARRVVVLERADTPLASDPPLLRELLAIAHRAVDNGRLGPDRHPDYPSWSEREKPRFISALYGIGGAPLTAGDLGASLDSDRSPIYLGTRLAPVDSALPARQVLIGELRRDYPDLDRLEPEGDRTRTELASARATVASIHRGESAAGERVALLASGLLQAIAGGHLRGSRERSREQWDHPIRDRIAHAADAVPAVDPTTPDDVALICEPRASLVLAATRTLRKAGAVVFDVADDEPLALAPDAAAALRAAGARLFRTAASPDEEPALRDERLAGALLAATGRADLSATALRDARRAALDDRPDDERDLLTDALVAGFEQLQPLELAAPAAPVEPLRAAPAALAHLRARDPRDAGAVDSLSRFWSQTAALYESPGRAEAELCADPYLTTGAIPPLSAALRGPRDGAALLPRFAADRCTGCGRCWTSCPDSAIAATALDAGSLLTHGADLAARAGADTASLRPLIGKLVPSIHERLRAAATPPTTGAGLVDEICRPVIEAAPLPDPRKQAALAALPAIADALGDLPLARTAPLFTDPERTRAGDGALLTIAIDPASCKGCGVCVADCADDALIAEKVTAESLRRAGTSWARWQAVPDSPGAVVARARAHADLGELPGLLLSRHAALAMAGADGTEPGSGARLALRLTMAAGELVLQQRLQGQLDQTRRLRSELTDAVRTALSRELPTDDLELLGRRLADLPDGVADLAALSSGDGGIDVASARSLVAAAHELGALEERLAVGAFGLGRSRLGLIMTAGPELDGVATFPYNPFSVPALVDATGEAAALARGAIEGQVRTFADEITDLRRARAALAGTDHATARDWAELTDDERQLCPPLLVVGGSAEIGDRALARLLDTDLPVVGLLLTDGASGRSALELVAFGLANPRLYVAQSSFGAPDHLARALLGALAHRGPALLQLHAPSPGRDGFPAAQLVDQARLAVATRAVQLLVLDPAAPGLFGTHLDLDGNPATDAAWATGDDDRELTPAAWLAGQNRFAGWPSARRDDFTERRRRDWRVLCELAGLDTPFTERVRAEAADAVRAAHAAEVAELQARHAAELDGTRAGLRAEAARQIRDRLMAMAGYDPTAAQDRS